LNGIGLIVALPREIPAGFVRIRSHDEKAVLPFVAYQYKTMPRQLMAAQVGIGQKRAAEKTRQFIAQFSPSALVSVGFAGGLNPSLARGTIVIATGLVPPHASQGRLDACKVLVDQLHASAQAVGLPVHLGSVVTAPRVVAEATAKAALWRACRAEAVEMEAAGVVKAAREHKLPWAAVRVIVDSAADTLPAACLSILDGDGRASMKALAGALCRSPSILWPLLTLMAGSARAHRYLSRLFAHWAAHLPAEGPLGQG
jgi:nucleoside phosphorylase